MSAVTAVVTDLQALGDMRYDYGIMASCREFSSLMNGLLTWRDL